MDHDRWQIGLIMKLKRHELQEFLLEKADQYAQKSFIKDDPILIPHRFRQNNDIEISGLLAATLAWGQRKTIIAKSEDLIERMDNAPADFVKNSRAEDLNTFNGFVHRTFQSEDIKGLISALKVLYSEYRNIGDFFGQHLDNQEHLGAAFSAFKGYLLENGLPNRAAKHFGDPIKGSACKRITMYSRWMTRSSKEGIDFGIWDINPSLLSLPLDVHSGRVARSLGLLKRKQSDWKAVLELDHAVRKIEPNDPARMDYALFGLGVYEGWK